MRVFLFHENNLQKSKKIFGNKVKRCNFTTSNQYTMKQLVFTSAWELVKTMGISLSMALTIAWAEAKIEDLNKRIAIAEGQAFNYKEVKALESIQLPLIKKLNKIKPCYVSFLEPSMAGAALWYGQGTYNGD